MESLIKEWIRETLAFTMRQVALCPYMDANREKIEWAHEKFPEEYKEIVDTIYAGTFKIGSREL